MMALPFRLAIPILFTALLGSWLPFVSPARTQGFEFGPFIEELQLTSQQKQRLRDIRSQYQPQLIEHQRQLQQHKATLIQMLVGTASETSIRSQHDRLTVISERLAELSFEGMLEVRTVLTPQQRSLLAEIMVERRRQQASEQP